MLKNISQRLIGLWQKKIILIVLGVLLLGGGAMMAVRLKKPGINLPPISSFEECLNAGYPVLESYPRQCKTPDGLSFVEEIKSAAISPAECQNDQECAQGFYCQDGACQQFFPDLSCQTHHDCQLINQDLGFSCGWLGVCDQADYSLEKWIGVNKNWLNQEREKNCPPQDECGARPTCNPKLINDNFTAKCVSGLCQKVAKQVVQQVQQKKITSCAEVDWNTPDLTFEMTYCRGDICDAIKNQNGCQGQDVVKIENGWIVEGSDGIPDCEWLGCPVNHCWPNR